MKRNNGLTRRNFLTTAGAAAGTAALSGRLLQGAFAAGVATTGPVTTPHADMAALRHDIVHSPVRVALHRAKTFTKVFQENEDKPWVLRKALALRQYFQTVPLYLREHDRLAGSITEEPGAMPVMVELGIGENGIYTGERTDRSGYLKGQVPDEIRDWWKNRNMWGLYRTEIVGEKPYQSADEVPQTLGYKFLSNQGHLSPSYGELLRVGLGGVLANVRSAREKGTGPICAKHPPGRSGKLDLSPFPPDKTAFLDAAEQALLGVTEWARRYADFLSGEAKRCDGAARAAELAEMARIAGKMADRPPETFREAMQLVWFVHQAIHIEGHGYSCTPDHIDRLLLPFYEADRKAGRLDDQEVVRLAENFALKMYDNTFWGPEHHLTQGLCVGGSTPDGKDLTNRLSWLFIEGATNLSLPEPLVWIRWHPAIDQQFFDFCLSRLTRSTCFPMMWNDNAVPRAFMELGVDRQDAFNYVPVGCNELAIPGQLYYNPGASCNYLAAIEAALTDGKGYKQQWGWRDVAPPTSRLATFDRFADAVGAYLRRAIQKNYEWQMKQVAAQIRWGKTPLTSCFFDGCIDQAHDMSEGTKYNVLSCGGIAFANAVDSLAAIRQVVYEKKQAGLGDVAQACYANFQGYERLRAQLLSAPKHGNDDPRLDDVIRLVERMRDEPVKEFCHDPRDGTPMGNSHVVRSGAVKQGLVTPATPDGRLAGTPLASSVAASVGCEQSGPTAVLNSVAKLGTARSWQCGYQANIRFHAGMIDDKPQRDKLRAMLNVYFAKGGEELQINVVSTATLRAAQKHPEQYSDLVVRVAGFSEFFVRLSPEMQEDIIARAEHR